MTDDVLLLAVVDDDADVRLALTRLMAAAGFAVETFGSGAEFLRWLNNHEPGCVILDLHMPEMSGADVQDALARRHPAVPVVVITGHDIPESRVRAMQSGASAYLCKPIDEDVLLEAIGRATGDVRG